MAKETMQAISDAELKARDTVLHAKEEGERIAAEAEATAAVMFEASVAASAAATAAQDQD